METKEIMNEQLTKIADGWMQKTSPTFDDLSESIIQTHQSAQYTAIRAVNQMATLRNWLIGCYIVEYEQKGSDRAKYGERLLKRLEERVNTKGLNLTLFKVSRNFYLSYPQIAELFSGSIHSIPSDESIDEKGATASHQFNNVLLPQKSATPSHKLIGKIHPTSSDKLIVPSSISATLSPKSEKMHEGDNLPVGILLCTRKGKKMVEYAIAGMDNNLFVSTYMLQLPDKATLEKFLLEEIGIH